MRLPSPRPAGHLVRARRTRQRAHYPIVLGYVRVLVRRTHVPAQDDRGRQQEDGQHDEEQSPEHVASHAIGDRLTRAKL
jgi:hypothetical protein